ncbi:MAG TPA: hypothetical protein VMF56_01575 [Acidobacteriaceae bacterium]|nr:hypothetical protein [Acidobacteriaceae bacterium]
MRSIARKRVIQELASRISSDLPKLAKKRPKTQNETKEYTWAVGQFWEKYRREKGSGWELRPENGGTKGHYLVDFILFDKAYGPRIACESEWGPGWRGVVWDFEKLAGVKSDIKVMIHECRSEELLDRLKDAISGNALISPSEAFLIIGFEGEKSQAHWWIPDRNGPFAIREIDFQLLPD